MDASKGFVLSIFKPKCFAIQLYYIRDRRKWFRSIYCLKLFLQSVRMVSSKFETKKSISIKNIFFEKIILNWTIEKQETVSVHQALNKEFLVDDTAIATHQISNKLDQLEKLVKKGESKSGHTLGGLTSWCNGLMV